MADAIVRICPTCGESFTSKATKKCKPCAKAYNAAWHANNRERVAARIKKQRSADPAKYLAIAEKWRAANPEKVKAGIAAYYKANREKSIERAKDWQRRNPEKVIARNKSAYRNSDPKDRQARRSAWAAAHPDKERAWRRAWRKANPDKRRISNQNRKALKRANGGSLSRGIIEKLFKLQRGLCVCCGKPLGDDYHLDHRVPLARGGKHEDSNMQLLKSKCNVQKRDKDPIEFMQSRGFLL